MTRRRCGTCALEVEALDALAHPALVRSFGAALDGAHPHVLIEHLEGPSLRRLIRRDGRLPLQQLLPLAAQVAGALQYMAQAGYVHLDVKPDNIVMGVPPRLIDLSIARTLERAAGTEGADRHRPLHGARAVRRGRAPDRAGRRHLGARRDSLPRGQRREAVPGGHRRVGPGAIPQLREGPGPAAKARSRSRSAPWSGRCSSAEPEGRPSCAEVVERLEPLIDELPKTMRLAKRGTAGS